MVLNQVDLESVPDHDDSTIYTATTPPETVDEDSRELSGGADLGPLLVPYPGSTFVIRSVSCGRVITLLDGQIVLTLPGTHDGHIHWKCAEVKGWLSFQNTASGRFLGHDRAGGLCCSAERHQGWENFCCRMRPEGGCVLLMTHWEKLWHVGNKTEWGEGKLAKIGEGGFKGIAWEFVKI